MGKAPRAMACFVSGLAIAAGCANLDGLSGGADGGSDAQTSTAPTGDAGTLDGSIDAGGAPAPCPCPDLDPMWSYLDVPRDASAAEACPPSATSMKLFTSIAATDTTCECRIESSTIGRCNRGVVTVTVNHVAGAACDRPGIDITFDGGGCVPIDGVVARRIDINKLPPTGGSCETALIQRPNDVVETAFEGCVPNECPAERCAEPPPGHRLGCVVADGEQLCPSTRFPNRRLVSTSYFLACSPCPTCAVDVTCATASLLLFSDEECITNVTTIRADDSCVTPSDTGATVRSAGYYGPATTSFDAGRSTGTVTPGPVKTLCCSD